MSALVAEPALRRDVDFMPLRECVIGWTGLAYYRDRDEALAAHVARRMQARGVGTCTEYLALLEDEGEADRLVQEITIGETFFFRHRELFEAIEREVLPECIARRGRERTLRVWSAGCATGEEPYSLAILLRERFADRLAGWRESILATDINRGALERAQRGLYGEWSLRALDESERGRWFTRRDAHWELAARFRAGVRFQHLNLAEEPFSDPGRQLAGLDLILCRNVLIYFDAALVRRVVRQFRECLAPGGWLLLGHAEFTCDQLEGFRVVSAPGALLLQKSPAAPSAPPVYARALPVPPGPPRAAVEPMAPAFAAQPPPAHTLAPRSELRSQMDQNEWSTALASCQRLLERTPLDPELHAHEAVIQEQLGGLEQAHAALRRALYLDRGDALAHYRLAMLERRRGNREASARGLRNAQGCLRAGGGRGWWTDEISPRELETLVEAAVGILEQEPR